MAINFDPWCFADDRSIVRWAEADAVFDGEVGKNLVSGDRLVQAPLAQIPWGPNLRILEAVKYPVDREWYIRYTIEQGWRRNLLFPQIK